MRCLPVSFSIFAFAGGLLAQTTAPSPGLTMLDPLGQPSATMFDTSEQVVHTWAFSAGPGIASYLDRDGNILRGYRTGATTIGAGGALERVAFDGTVLWDYALPGQHHDIHELPNGNVLCIVGDELTQAEMANLGRDPANTTALWSSERIVEVQPTGPTSGTIVWEWRAIEHLIQDFDPTAPGFGTVSSHPERINVNYPDVPGSALWLHMNSIDYDAEHDQIIVGVRNLSELWVLDHSTTTQEASGSSGGIYGRGGDILYRWGNPAAYDAPGPQQLFWQHDVNVVKPGRPGAGNFLCFNNRKGDLIGLPDVSAVTEIAPPRDATGSFAYTAGSAYLPAAPVWEYMAPVPQDLFSSIMSSAERLPNGNTLVLSSTQGRAFELGLNDQIVWEVSTALTYKARRYQGSMWAGSEELSIASGGSVPFDYVPGTAFSGQLYVVAGSISGTDPGFQFGGATIPLNPDAYLDVSTSSFLLTGALGLVGTDGRASASFVLPPGIAGGFAGTTFHHAFVTLDSSLMVSHVSDPRGILLQ